jgi:thiamine-phosphate pyrophosphorylase
MNSSGESTALRRALRLYLVVGGLDEAPLLALVGAALRGGVGCVQLREKNLATRAFVARARALRALLRDTGVPLIVNDRLDVALAAGADGVHLGQDDLEVDAVRRHMPQAIVGLSVGSLAELDAGLKQHVDYLSPSPLFATRSKPDAGAPLGLDGLRAMRARSPLPLVAIGGIERGNAAAVFAAGADGIAVVSAIGAAPDPQAAAAELAAIAGAA